MKRRDFLRGCCTAAVGAGVMPMTGFFNPLAFGAARGANGDILVYLFLRGGIDGLHLVVPYSGDERAAYEARRGALTIDTDILRRLGDSQWALHPRAGGEAGYPIGGASRWLVRLWDEGKLAIVQGTGMPTALSRSHFDAQAFIDLGTPGDKTTPDGWLTRYLQHATGLPAAQLSHAFGFASAQPLALMRADDAFTVTRAQDFRVDGFPWSWHEPGNEYVVGAHHRLVPLWQDGAGELGRAGRLAADALAEMRTIDFAGYTPTGGAEYPNSNFGAQLSNLAQLIKEDTGLVVSTLDYGGWDTHEGQGRPNPGNPTGYEYFGNQLEGLARGLDAFYTDLSSAPQGNLMNRVNIVMLSEFGRNIEANVSGGTDHGYGNLMLVLGGMVNGGQFHGEFPGLDKASDFEGQDVAVTTDFRQVLAESLVKRMGFPQNQLGQVFPDFDYTPLEVFL